VAELDQKDVVKSMNRSTKFENGSQERILLPKVGRFDVTWPVVAADTPEVYHKPAPSRANTAKKTQARQ